MESLMKICSIQIQSNFPEMDILIGDQWTGFHFFNIMERIEKIHFLEILFIIYRSMCIVWTLLNHDVFELNIQTITVYILLQIYAIFLSVASFKRKDNGSFVQLDVEERNIISFVMFNIMESIIHLVLLNPFMSNIYFMTNMHCFFFLAMCISYIFWIIGDAWISYHHSLEHFLMAMDDQSDKEYPVYNTFIEVDISKIKDEICPICQEMMVFGEDIYQLSCLHYMHKECIEKWWSNSKENRSCCVYRCNEPIYEK